MPGAGSAQPFQNATPGRAPTPMSPVATVNPMSVSRR